MKLRFTEILRERGMSYQDLANMAGVPAASMNNLKEGNTTITSLERYAELLGIPVWELLVDAGSIPESSQNGGVEISNVAMSINKCPHCGKDIKFTIVVAQA